MNSSQTLTTPSNTTNDPTHHVQDLAAVEDPVMLESTLQEIYDYFWLVKEQCHSNNGNRNHELDMMHDLNQMWQRQVIVELRNAYNNNNDLIHSNLHAAIHEHDSVQATYFKERWDHLDNVTDVIDIIQALSGEIVKQFGGNFKRGTRGEVTLRAFKRLRNDPNDHFMAV